MISCTPARVPAVCAAHRIQHCAKMFEFLGIEHIVRHSPNFIVLQRLDTQTE